MNDSIPRCCRASISRAGQVSEKEPKFSTTASGSDGGLARPSRRWRGGVLCGARTQALLQGDFATLDALIDANFDLRSAVVQDRGRQPRDDSNSPAAWRT